MLRSSALHLCHSIHLHNETVLHTTRVAESVHLHNAPLVRRNALNTPECPCVYLCVFCVSTSETSLQHTSTVSVLPPNNTFISYIERRRVLACRVPILPVFFFQRCLFMSVSTILTGNVSLSSSKNSSEASHAWQTAWVGPSFRLWGGFRITGMGLTSSPYSK